MKKFRWRINQLAKEENGQILFIAALLMVALISIVGLAVDVGCMSMMRVHLTEVGHVIRDARMNETILIENSENPAQTFDQIAKTYAAINGLDSSQVSTSFTTTKLTSTERDYELYIYLKDTYNYTFLRIFGFTSREINIAIKGTGTIDRSSGVWAPGR